MGSRIFGVVDVDEMKITNSKSNNECCRDPKLKNQQRNKVEEKKAEEEEKERKREKILRNLSGVVVVSRHVS